MKSINKKHTYRKVLAIAVVLLLVIICGVFLWLHFTNKPQSSNKNTTDTSYTKPTADQQKAGDDIKSDISKEGTSTSDDPSSPTPIAGSDKKSVGITISYAQSSGDSQYLIRTIIDTVTSTGACTLTMTKAGSPTVTLNSGTQASASTSTCKGFNVPLTSLSEGTWNATVDFSDGNLVGSVSKQVTI